MKSTVYLARWTATIPLLIAVFAMSAWAQDSRYAPFTFMDELIPAPPCLTMHNAWEGGGAPCTPLMHQQWLSDLTHWRAERRIRIGFDPARYSLSSLTWTQSSFIQPQMMVQDRSFYDPVQGKYKVDRYLDDLDKRYGGIDSVLVRTWALTTGTNRIWSDRCRAG